jgi:hypothetical protein
MTIIRLHAKVRASNNQGGKAMADQVHARGGRRAVPWRIIGWGTAVFLLILPLVANAPWTASDFVVAAVLLGSVGLGFEFIVRKSSSWAYRAAAALGVIGAFHIVWVNGAVGMIRSEDNPYNLLFGIVLLVALTGTIVAKLRADGMARAMAAAGVTQVALGAFGFPSDARGAIFTMVLSGIWFLSAVLFRICTNREDD